MLTHRKGRDRAVVIRTDDPRWLAAVEEARSFTDRLGRGMDPGVVPVVAALRLGGLPTSASCWGHVHRPACPGPWIHVGPGEFPKIWDRVDAVLAGFNAGRTRVRTERRLAASVVHGHETLRPEIARIEAASTRQVRYGDREPRPTDLRAARREMHAFASYLLTSW